MIVVELANTFILACHWTWCFRLAQFSFKSSRAQAKFFKPARTIGIRDADSSILTTLGALILALISVKVFSTAATLFRSPKGTFRTIEASLLTLNLTQLPSCVSRTFTAFRNAKSVLTIFIVHRDALKVNHMLDIVRQTLIV